MKKLSFLLCMILNIVINAQVSVNYLDPVNGARIPVVGLSYPYQYDDVSVDNSVYYGPSGTALNFLSTADPNYSGDWGWIGSLRCQGDPNNRDVAIKSGGDEGSAWVTGTATEGKYMVVDLGSARDFNEFDIWQMFSDGKVTHVQLFVHPNLSGGAPVATDASWTQVFSKSNVGNDANYPTRINSFGWKKSRFLKFVFWNDGSLNSPSYIEVKQVKIFGVGTPPVPDCNGVLGGTALVDSCGVCTGGNTGKYACKKTKAMEVLPTGNVKIYKDLDVAGNLTVGGKPINNNTNLEAKVAVVEGVINDANKGNAALLATSTKNASDIVSLNTVVATVATDATAAKTTADMVKGDLTAIKNVLQTDANSNLKVSGSISGENIVATGTAINGATGTATSGILQGAGLSIKQSLFPTTIQTKFFNSDYNNYAGIGTLTDNPLTFYTNNGFGNMTILSNGNVGINTHKPLYKLHVLGDVKFEGKLITNSISIGDVELLNTGFGPMFNGQLNAKYFNAINGFKIDGSNTTFTSMQAGSVNAGSNMNPGTVKVIHINFKNSITNPVIMVTAKATGNYSDTFCVTTRNVTTTGFDVNIYRPDGDRQWGQDVIIDWFATSSY